MTNTDTLRIHAGRLIDGTGAEAQENVTVTVEDGLITHVEPGGMAGDAALDLSGYTLMPGLINMHAHTVLPGDGTPFEEWMQQPDEILLLQAYANARTSLYAGVTTIRECGGKDLLTFRLRDAIRAGIVEGPRLVLSGWPLTITGGHCRYFGGETDGVEGMRLGAREVLKRGADFVKIMASGGGTLGTYSQFPSFDVEELRAAIDEAHKVRKPASCHAIATESIERSLDAGTDHIEHCSFVAPDTSWAYDDALARRVAEQGVYVTATLQVGFDRHDALREMHARGEAMTAVEQAQFAGIEQGHANSIANIRNLHDCGVKIVAGSDAGWRHTGFDDFYLELVYLVEAGLTPLEAIHAATGRAAAACRLEHVVGTVAPGQIADLLAIAGDPSTDFTTLREPAMIIQAGHTIVDRR